jgi:hypothetical protein
MPDEIQVTSLGIEVSSVEIQVTSLEIDVISRECEATPLEVLQGPAWKTAKRIPNAYVRPTGSFRSEARNRRDVELDSNFLNCSDLRAALTSKQHALVRPSFRPPRSRVSRGSGERRVAPFPPPG